MNTDPYVLQQLVNNHRRDLVEAAHQSRLCKDVAVTRRGARRPVAGWGWHRRPAAVRSAVAH
jgi:hypothetical protein